MLQPIQYYSASNSPVECNHEIYNKKLVALMRAFEEWYPELEVARLGISVISDHKTLAHFTTSKRLNHLQARWWQYISSFNFDIIYQSGKQEGKPDALTWRSENLPEEEDKRQADKNQTVLKKENFDLKLNLLLGSIPNKPTESDNPFIELMTEQ